MECKTLLRANLNWHKGSILGIFVLLLLVSLSLATVLTVRQNAGRYVRSEMDRLGFGTLTTWVSGTDEISPLASELASLEEIAAVGIQELIFSEYEIGDQESDSEGQLIVYDPERYPYRIFTDDLSGYQAGDGVPGPGEVYVSPSLRSMFGVELGNTITFPIARNGVDKTFVVKGYFEDPFMGSSMIGMKSFLICEADCREIAGMIGEAGIDGLARHGYMLHIFQSPDSNLSTAAFNALLNEQTNLQSYTEFTHSHAAISGFMLTLQNVFTSLLLAFVAVLVLAALAILSHSIGSSIQQDYVNLGILKAIGFTSRQLRLLQLLQYLIGIICGMAAGVLLAIPIAYAVCHITITTTGLLIPSAIPLPACAAAFAALLLVLSGFIWLRTGRLRRVSPLQAIRGNGDWDIGRNRTATPVRQGCLGFWMALRQLASGKRRYLGACMVAMLLVFFASLVGRVNTWLGPNGEGLMDAFNPADLHIAAQPMGRTGIEDVEQTILEYTGITGEYMLAMPGVSVNGVDYTANVITQPERFHMLAGRTCQAPDEVVLTEFVAADLGVSIRDRVTVAGNLGSGDYTVSGIYQCANDMGANLGMNRAGYAQIGEDTPNMWCTHFFLADPGLQPLIVQELEARYGGDVYLHENSWPGLYGILSAMSLLMIFLYGVVVLFVLVVTLLTAGKLLKAEERDLGICRAMGFSAGRLRRSFALRFGLTALVGSALGTVLSSLLTDPLVALLMRLEGISNFSSHPGILALLFPGIAVILLFSLFAWVAAGKIRRSPLSVLTAE